MTDIQRIKQIDVQLKELKRMLDRGEHVGAGLSIGVSVGPLAADDSYKVDLGVGFQTEEILKALIFSLEQSRKAAVSLLRMAHQEISAFLAAETSDYKPK